MSFFYKFDKIIPFSKKGKLKLYLDLEWIFERLAHEQSFRVFGDENHPVRNASVNFLLDRLTSSHEVLDLGCKCGDLTFLLSKNVKSITGIDLDPKAIEDANNKYGRYGIVFLNDDAIALLKRNKKKFDVLVLSHVLEHLEDPDSLLKSCRGYFDYVYIEAPDHDRTHLNLYRSEVKSSLRYSDADHIWEFDRRTLQKLMIDNNLIIQDMEFIWGVQKYWCRVN